MAKVSKYGQWQYPGEDTLIPNVNGSITMQGVPYPVLGIDDLGNQMMMMPGVDYQFPGNSVYEIPMAQNGGESKISDPNVIAQMIADYKTNSYRRGGSVLRHYQGDIGSSTAKQQALERDWNRQQARAWDPNELNGAQEVPMDTPVVVKPMTIAPPAKNAPKKSKEQIAKDAAVKQDKKAKNDPTLWLAEHPEYMIGPDGTPILRAMMEQAAPEELKAADVKQAKEEFVKQLNADPLQQSLGTASLDNPVTNAAAERYANYKVNKVDPGRASDKMFRGYMPPNMQDFYRPNELSNTLRGAAGLGATAAGVAGLSALGTGAIMLAPEAYAAAQPFIQATGAALNASPTWAPGLSLGNTLAAYDLAYVGKEALDPNSMTRQSINVAVDNPNTDNILNAAGTVGLTALDALGAGLFKGGRDLAKDVYTGLKAPFKMPSPSVTNPDLQMAGFSPANVLAKIKETDYYKALMPGQRSKLLKEIEESDDLQRGIWDELNRSSRSEWGVRNEIEDKLKNREFYRYLARRKASLNTQSSGKGYLNYIIPPKRQAVEKAGQFTLQDGKLVATEPSPFFAKDAYTGDGVVTTGQKQIVDLRTGKLVNASVEPSGSVKSFSLDESQKLQGQRGTLNKETLATTANIGEPYKEALKNNITYVEETVPGAKVFGSSRGVAEGSLPHLSDDYDVFISESNYNKNVKGKFQKTKEKNSAQVHDISPDGRGARAGKEDAENAYNIDFNIIHENPDGTVKPVWKMGPNGFEYSREVELFRQNFPEEFYEATKAAAKSGNPKNIKINKTADELINSFDPTVKTIMDAYESGKPKHVNRIDAYINFGDVNKVQQAQEKLAKSLVGKNGNIGKQFPESAFFDTNKNKQILSKIGFIGDADIVAADPKRMQLAINDYYLNNSILSRNVNTDSLHGRDASSAFKSWYAKDPGGTLRGTGQNFVKLGASKHMEEPGVTLTGFRQLNLDNNFDDPLEYVNAVFRQTDGDYILNEDELKTVNTLLDKHFGQGTAASVDASKPITKSEDLILIHKSANPNLLPADNNYTKHDRFLKDVNKELGIKAITNKTEGLYGNSIYTSTLAEFDEFLDGLGFGYLGGNVPTDFKSYSQRLSYYEHRAANMKSVKDIVDSRDFKRVEGYIKGGLPKAQERLAALEREAFDIDRELQKLQNAYTKEERARLAELEARTQQLNTEWRAALDKKEQLQILNNKIGNIRLNTALGLAAPAAGIGAIMGLNYLNDETLEEGEELKTPMEQWLPEVEAFKKKLGGEVKFGSKPFIGYLPFTHYQLK